MYVTEEQNIIPSKLKRKSQNTKLHETNLNEIKLINTPTWPTPWNWLTTIRSWLSPTLAKAVFGTAFMYLTTFFWNIFYVDTYEKQYSTYSMHKMRTHELKTQRISRFSWTVPHRSLLWCQNRTLKLTPLTGNSYTTNTTDDARVNISAKSFWGSWSGGVLWHKGFQRISQLQQIKKLLQTSQKWKKTTYNQWII